MRPLEVLKAGIKEIGDLRNHYKEMIGNINWHIEKNRPKGDKLLNWISQVKDYESFIRQLDRLERSLTPPKKEKEKV